MKQLIAVLIFLFVNSCLFSQHSLENLWQTDTVLKAPESVRYDPNSKVLYVSSIGEWGKDGTGYVSKVGLDGKIIKKDWVTGLSGTKGLGLYNNIMYAAEQTTVAVIDMTKEAVIRRIAIEGSEMLNDVTIDSKGVVYVSDSKTGKVHRIEKGKSSVYMENLKDINGLLAVGDDLYILAGASLQKADANKKLTLVADGIEGAADGIEMIGSHEFIVTGWVGTIYHVKDDGSKQLLLDTRDKKISAADLGYDPVGKTVYIPAMSKNSVMAYTFK